MLTLTDRVQDEGPLQTDAELLAAARTKQQPARPERAVCGVAQVQHASRALQAALDLARQAEQDPMLDNHARDIVGLLESIQLTLGALT